MKRIKKLATILSAAVMMLGLYTFVTPTSKAKAASPGNGLLEPGEFYDVTPSVYVGPNDAVTIAAVHPYGSRTTNIKLVRYSPSRVVYADKYMTSNMLSITGGPEDPNYYSAGWYRIEMRCTSGSTKYYDCNTRAWFDAWNPTTESKPKPPFET
ncbi:hypothetical protein CON70_08515 [Bacillus pseudomycoides]|nr:hypothetical protein CON70_08515 [Bacillus pseudomycoides]